MYEPELAEGRRVVIEVVSGPALHDRLTRDADFITMDSEEGPKPAWPPARVVEIIPALPHLPFPRLRGIATIPLWLPNGRLVAANGYEPTSGWYFDLGELEGITAAVPAAEALAWLDQELLGDFGFADEPSRAHAIAMFLERFARPFYRGLSPLHVGDATGPGSGKGLLMTLLGIVVQGAPPAVMGEPSDETETAKEITALLMVGQAIIDIDNVRKPMSSGALARALTGITWEGRILGVSRMASVPNESLWVCTGNNVALSDEIARRSIVIRLDPDDEHPEERTGPAPDVPWRHPDIAAWAHARRRELVAACLSCVRAWLEAGRPAGTVPLGSFEGWARVLGGILQVLGVRGFLGNRDEFRSEVDQESAEWAELTRAWWEQYEAAPIAAKDILVIAIREGLLADIWAGRKEVAAAQRMGHQLRTRRGRIHGGFRVLLSGKASTTKNGAYRLEPAPMRRSASWSAFHSATEESSLLGGVSDGEPGVSGENTPPEGPKHPGDGPPVVDDPRVTDPAEEPSGGVWGVSGVSDPTPGPAPEEIFADEGDDEDPLLGWEELE